MNEDDISHIKEPKVCAPNAPSPGARRGVHMRDFVAASIESCSDAFFRTSSSALDWDQRARVSSAVRARSYELDARARSSR